MRDAKIVAIILILGLMLSSCSDKKNKVKAGPSGPGGTPQLGPTFDGQLGNIYGQVNCQYGTRLPEIPFNISGGAQGTQHALYGNPQPGHIGGQVTQVYFGRSGFGDVITVAKVANGPQVIGYNLSISFCEHPPLIVAGRNLHSPQIPYGIIIDDNTGCGHGFVDSAFVRFIADPYQHTPAGYVDTSFTKLQQCY